MGKMKITLSVPVSLKWAASSIGAHTDKDAQIKFITTDTRELSEGGLFFALGGGEDYVPRALGLGFCISSTHREALFVKDTKTALLKLASRYKDELLFLKKTVGITGSVGKTSVKDYTAAIIGTKYKTHKTNGNFNNEIGLPLSIFASPEDTEALILEMGMNQAGEIKRLSEAAKPDIAVITNIGTAHIGKLGSKENTALAKREILYGLSRGGKLIIPSDEPLLSDIPDTVSVGDGGEYFLKNLRAGEDDMRFRIATPIGISDEIHLPFGGIHFAKNLLFASAASIEFGLCIDDINCAFSDFHRFIPRQKYIKIKNFYIYDDSYNASLESYVADFELLSLKSCKKSALVGDILELGDKAELVHRRLGALAASYDLSEIYPFGKYARFVAEGALAAGFPKERIFQNDDPTDYKRTAKMILEQTSCGAVVLIKGSHALKTEKITDELLRNGN